MLFGYCQALTLKRLESDIPLWGEGEGNYPPACNRDNSPPASEAATWMNNQPLGANQGSWLATLQNSLERLKTLQAQQGAKHWAIAPLLAPIQALGLPRAFLKPAGEQKKAFPGSPLPPPPPLSWRYNGSRQAKHTEQGTLCSGAGAPGIVRQPPRRLCSVHANELLWEMLRKLIAQSIC